MTLGTRLQQVPCIIVGWRDVTTRHMATTTMLSRRRRQSYVVSQHDVASRPVKQASKSTIALTAVVDLLDYDIN